MIRVAIKLFLLFLLVYLGVTFWYGRLEKQLATSPPVVPSQNPAEKSVEQPVGKPGKDLQKSSNYQIIVARNIFEAVLEQDKVEAKEEQPAPEVEKEPEETTLKLVLHGTVSGTEGDARAIIVDEKEKRQDIYQIGDAVQGALITSIERGKVILTVKGKKQLLLLKDREGGGPGGNFVEPSDMGTSNFIPSGSSLPGRIDRPPPAAVPHRRISFRQKNNEDEIVEAEVQEEPVEPLLGENMGEEPPLPEEVEFQAEVEANLPMEGEAVPGTEDAVEPEMEPPPE